MLYALQYFFQNPEKAAINSKITDKKIVFNNVNTKQKGLPEFLPGNPYTYPMT